MENSVTVRLGVIVCVLAMLAAMPTLCVFAESDAETKPDTADAIVEGVGCTNVCVGMKREHLIEALGKPDNDPASDWLKWGDKHIDCTFHAGSLVVSEVRFNQGFNGALANGLRLGSSGSAMLKLYGESDHAKVQPNGARQYEYSTRGILFWTFEGQITQIVVFKPYSLTRMEPTAGPPRVVSTSPANGDRDVDPATAELAVTFDRDMKQDMTWNSDGPESLHLPGSKAFWRDRRTCVLPVKLEAGESYRVGLNSSSPNSQAFQSVAGVRLPSTTIHFATRDTRKAGESAEASKVLPQPAKNVVVEGVGWESFRIGATRDDLIKAYGEPDSNPGNSYLRWTSQHHVDCLLGKNGRAVEVRFNKGFDKPLTSGVRIGSAEKEVLLAYGEPDRFLQQSQAKMLVFGKRGVLMWIIDGKVFDFTAIEQH